MTQELIDFRESLLHKKKNALGDTIMVSDEYEVTVNGVDYGYYAFTSYGETDGYLLIDGEDIWAGNHPAIEVAILKAIQRGDCIRHARQS